MVWILFRDCRVWWAYRVGGFRVSGFRVSGLASAARWLVSSPVSRRPAP